MKKKILYLLSSCIILMMLSCSGNDLALGSTNPAETTIDVWYYMGATSGGAFCSEIFEGLKEVEVRIAVDRYTGLGTFDQNFQNYRFYVHNDDATNTEDYQFVVEVPETGSYAISINLDGDECYDCCNGNSCNNTGGRPSWRGLSAVLNQFPPPPEIDMGSTVEYIDCF